MNQYKKKKKKERYKTIDQVAYFTDVATQPAPNPIMIPINKVIETTSKPNKAINDDVNPHKTKDHGTHQDVEHETTHTDITDTTFGNVSHVAPPMIPVSEWTQLKIGEEHIQRRQAVDYILPMPIIPHDERGKLEGSIKAYPQTTPYAQAIFVDKSTGTESSVILGFTSTVMVGDIRQIDYNNYDTLVQTYIYKTHLHCMFQEGLTPMEFIENDGSTIHKVRLSNPADMYYSRDNANKQPNSKLFTTSKQNNRQIISIRTMAHSKLPRMERTNRKHLKSHTHKRNDSNRPPPTRQIRIQRKFL